MADKLGLKETLELLAGVKVLAVAGVKIGKDGVDASDLQHVAALVKDFEKLSQAVQGADGSLAEIKDLDEAEVVQLVASVYDIVKAVKEASA